MVALVLFVLIFLLSFLVLFRAPTKLLWYVSILVTEFCWVFIFVTAIILCWPTQDHFAWWRLTLGGGAVLIFCLPVIQAVNVSKKLRQDFPFLFQSKQRQQEPFHIMRMFFGINSRKRRYQKFIYDESNGLSLHFYPSVLEGFRPCIIVIHGGSWAGGNNLQLADLNSKLAFEGYHVASIHYRLAPKNRYPCQLQDVKSALDYLSAKADVLSINVNAFTLLGRSAGGQIALSAAYTLTDKRIKSVIAFYAPTDMIWGYSIRCSPLVLDSRKVMEDYLGGTVNDVYDQYHQSSPTETVTKDAPPTLLFYAEHDPLVSPRHGNRLTKKLEAKNVKHFALYLPWATHGFDYTLNGPAGQLSTWTVLQFLEAIYRKP